MSTGCSGRLLDKNICCRYPETYRGTSSVYNYQLGRYLTSHDSPGFRYYRYHGWSNIFCECKYFPEVHEPGPGGDAADGAAVQHEVRGPRVRAHPAPRTCQEQEEELRRGLLSTRAVSVSRIFHNIRRRPNSIFN